MSPVDSSNSKCVVDPNDYSYWTIIDAIISWRMPDEWVLPEFLGRSIADATQVVSKSIEKEMYEE